MQNSIDSPLKGKKILFLLTYTFGYETHIKNAMEAMGAEVDSFNERPDDGFMTKALLRINRKLIAKKVNDYHREIIEETREKEYDYVFFEKCQSFSRKSITRLKELHPQAKFILYLWDSFVCNKNPLSVLDLFDKVMTFDRKDSIDYSIPLLPLFYVDTYSKIGSHENYKYKSMFIGTLHTDRYKMVSSINSFIESKGYTCFSYFFLPSKILYWKMRLQDSAIKNMQKNEVKYVSLKIDQILKLYEESEIVIDIQDPAQTGLTMRTFETLGAKRKMITTNKDIVNYDFYNSNNILVVDRNDIKVPASFIEGRYEPLPDEIYMKYSLSNWVKTIFSE